MRTMLDVIVLVWLSLWLVSVLLFCSSFRSSLVAVIAFTLMGTVLVVLGIRYVDTCMMMVGMKFLVGACCAISANL